MSELFMKEAGYLQDEDNSNVEELNGRRIFRFLRPSKHAPVMSAVVPNSRSEFGKRLFNVSKNIRDGFANGSRQSVDRHFMVIKSISGQKSVKMFEYSDDKQVGFNMIHQGQLQKEEVFLLDGITILMGTHTAPIVDAATAAAAKWEEITGAVINGLLEFKADNKTIIPEMSLQVFGGSVEKIDTTNGIGYRYGKANRPVGYYRLDNPKLIPTQTALELEVTLGAAAPANTALKVILHGSSAYKK